MADHGMPARTAKEAARGRRLGALASSDRVAIRNASSGATLSCHCATTTSTLAKTHCRRWQLTAHTADVSACEVASKVLLLMHQRTCSSTALGSRNYQIKAPLIVSVSAWPPTGLAAWRVRCSGLVRAVGRHDKLTP
jgi:hypothetical protein